MGFIVGKETFNAHKNFLKIRAPHLHSLFLCDTDSPMDEFHLPEKINDQVFQHLLKFVYTDCIDDDFLQENASHILNAANYCGVERLKQMAESKLIDSIDVENVIDMIFLADSVHCASL